MNQDDTIDPNGTERSPEEAATDLGDAAGEATAGEIGKLRNERDELYDRLLRKGAEFDNYRKRVEKERRDLAEWAAADLIADILSVLDDFERALSVDAPPEATPYKSGVELIHRQLGELLRKRGVTPIESLGADFDPHLHQAVSYEESHGAREGEVVGELRKGYRLGERLLRPAMVKVAKAS